MAVVTNPPLEPQQAVSSASGAPVAPRPCPEPGKRARAPSASPPTPCPCPSPATGKWRALVAAVPDTADAEAQARPAPVRVPTATPAAAATSTPTGRPSSSLAGYTRRLLARACLRAKRTVHAGVVACRPRCRSCRHCRPANPSAAAHASDTVKIVSTVSSTCVTCVTERTERRTCTTSTTFSSSACTSTGPTDAAMGRRCVLQEQRSLKAGELSQQENKSVAASCLKMHTENFSSEKVGSWPLVVLVPVPLGAPDCQFSVPPSPDR